MKKSIIFLLILFSIYSCNNDSSNQDSYKNSDVISKTLENAIIDFINYFDSLAYSSKTSYTPPVYEVEFLKQNDTCFISIISSDFYHERDFKGFLKIKNKIIAFFNPGDSCSTGMLDETKLVKELDEYKKGVIEHDLMLDNLERKYKILNQDSLELVSFNFTK